MELDGVFLDMYGTITTGDRLAVETVCRRIIADTGARISAHELSITWGERFFHALDFCNGADFLTLFDVEVKTLRATMSRLGVMVDPTPYVEQLSQYWQNPPLQSDVPSFIAEFPLPICIVSNADHADASAGLAAHNIEVAQVVTSEDVRYYKPDRRIFEAALELTGWRRERVIHVGDSLHSDVGGALVAGLRSGWINRAHRIHDIGAYEPDYEFEDLHGLTALVQQ
ncbi:MAG: HAD family hydrolase [Planctomycetes bacterium]|nr:HAD family hydrolase [Planctomycetota bacterium]